MLGKLLAYAQRPLVLGARLLQLSEFDKQSPQVGVSAGQATLVCGLSGELLGQLLLNVPRPLVLGAGLVLLAEITKHNPQVDVGAGQILLVPVHGGVPPAPLAA